MQRRNMTANRGKRIKPTKLTPEQKRTWAEMAHLYFIDALSNSTPLKLDKISFHGGTNLHLSWGSPRYSEDLDFLVSDDFGATLEGLMPKIKRRMEALVKAVDPDLSIDFDNRTKDGSQLLNYRISMTSKMKVGKVMVKAEFWQVNQDYMNQYESTFRQPQSSLDVISRVSQPIPSATLDSTFADKVVALAYRPHLKWRDLFDLWWLDRQRKAENDMSLKDRLPQILQNASAYKPPEGSSLKIGLTKFLERDPEAVLEESDPDLKRWISNEMWSSLYPHAVNDMITYARSIAQEVVLLLEEIEKQPPGETSKVEDEIRDTPKADEDDAPQQP